MLLLKGQPVAEKIKQEIKKAVDERIAEEKDLPKIAILRVGDRADDIAYEARVLKNCAELNIQAEVTVLKDSVTMREFRKTLEVLNNDLKIHGILLFRPLPEQLNMERISGMILPEKDIDCMNPKNMEKVFSGDTGGILPCTPEAVIEILKYYDYELCGKNVVIANRSMVLGKPLSMMFLQENATVTICHSKTKNMIDIMRQADIVVTGVGRGKLFSKEYFSDQSVVIDVGINYLDGSLCGDVDFENVKDTVKAITPVPGGVGTVTSMILLKHVIQAMLLQTRFRKE